MIVFFDVFDVILEFRVDVFFEVCVEFVQVVGTVSQK